jgi:hypothetical protein
MYSITQLEKFIVSVVSKKLNVKVYNNVPKDAAMPFIRIGDINIQDGFILPKTYKCKLELTYFDDNNSNASAVVTAENIRNLLKDEICSTKCIDVKYTGSQIYQLKNGVWCSDIGLEFEIYGDENEIG